MSYPDPPHGSMNSWVEESKSTLQPRCELSAARAISPPPVFASQPSVVRCPAALKPPPSIIVKAAPGGAVNLNASPGAKLAIGALKETATSGIATRPGDVCGQA